MGLRRLWIKLTVEVTIKEVNLHFPLFSYFGSRASANPSSLLNWFGMIA